MYMLIGIIKFCIKYDMFNNQILFYSLGWTICLLIIRTFYQPLLLAIGRFSSLCSGCEGKPWHESWAVLHWWLVMKVPYVFMLWSVEYFVTIMWILWFIASGKAAEFGLLKDGYMFETSTGLSRMWDFCFACSYLSDMLGIYSLMLSLNTWCHCNLKVSHYTSVNLTILSFRLLSSPTCPVLEALGKQLSFEIAVGLNGRVWVWFLMPFLELMHNGCAVFHLLHGS